MLPGKRAAASSATPCVRRHGGDGATVHEVRTGPNTGYYFVDYWSYSVHRYRQINERLFSNGPKEIPDGDSTVRHWDLLKKYNRPPELALAGTWAHEGYGQNGAKGHQGQIEKALRWGKCGDAGRIAARIVAPTFEKARDLRDATEEIADTAFVMATLHNHVYGNHGAGSPVVFWKTGEAWRIGNHQDRHNPKQNYSFSSPGCDWRSF